MKDEFRLADIAIHGDRDGKAWQVLGMLLQRDSAFDGSESIRLLGGNPSLDIAMTAYELADCMIALGGRVGRVRTDNGEHFDMTPNPRAEMPDRLPKEK